MSKFKKIAATLVAAATAAACAGCNNNAMAYPLTIDGVQVKAGIYIYYSYQAYTEAISTIQEQDSELDTEDDDVVKEQTIDGKDAETWIRDKTMQYCKEYVAVQKDFEDKGLELTSDETSYVEEYVESAWETSGEVFEKNGIAQSSVEDVFLSSYKEQELFLYYYNVDGEKGVTEDELKDYYIENDARVRYIQFDLTDGNGDALDDDGKEEMAAMVEDYLAVLEKLEGDEDAINEEMDNIQEEYNAYVTSISEEAAAETATSATDENGSEIAATTTTTVTTTTAEETTTAETTTTTTAVAETTDTTETTVAGEDEDSDADTTTESTAETREARSTSETTDTTDSGAEDEETDTTETTTTTAPYANETIITKVSSTSEGDSEDSISYTPSEKAYEAIFADDVELDTPFIVEDDEADYLIVRFDIENRMDEDDLWTEDQIKSVASRKYWDEFTTMKEDMAADLSVEQKDHAIKKYDPFKLDFSTDSSSS